jgi:dUTP pyrophosphatase
MSEAYNGVTIPWPPPLKFKQLSPDAILPTRANEGDAGVDIYALEDVTIPPTKITEIKVQTDDSGFVRGADYLAKIGQAKISTGIAVEIPYGFYGKVSSRSGLAFKSGIFSFDGTVDSGYRSEIGILLFNTTDKPYQVKKGDRIAQLLIIPCSILEPVFADELSDTERGDKGYGSSGK